MVYDDYVPPIEFTPSGQSDDERDAILKIVKPSPGFPITGQILAEAIQKEAITTVLDFTPKQVAVRFQIDGLWHAGAPMDRETGDYMLATLKKIAGMEYRERRARQQGTFKTLYLKKKQTFKIVSQGVKTGERVAIYLDWKKPPMDTAEQLGMRGSMEKQVSEVLENPKTGMLLVSAVPGEGYTSAWRGVLQICDRLTRDYFVIEEKTEVEPEVINVNSIEFDRSKGEDVMTPLTQLLLKQPDVLAFNELPDAKTIDNIIELSTNKSIPIYTRAPGKGAIDAVLRLLILKPNAKQLISRLDGVVTMRLVRKLCEDCKYGFQPHPSLLKKLGIPPGRVGELFKPLVYKPGMVDENENEIEPCTECHGIGYKGRTGIFEFLKMNDQLRQGFLESPRIDKLSAIAKKAGHISMMQEGIVVVARGMTSIEELQRVLKA